MNPPIPLTSSSQFCIDAVTPADSPELAKVMMTAMYQDLNWAILWGSMPLSEIIADCAERLPWNLVSNIAKKRHLKVTDASTGEVVGYGRWVLPNHLGLEVWPEARVEQPDAGTLKDYRARFDAVTVDGGQIRGMDRHIANELFNDLYSNEMDAKGSREFFELDYMTVLPSYQRKGVAGMLVRAGNQAADKLGLPTYLMAMPQGVGLYAKYGFHVVKTIVKRAGTWSGSQDYVQTFMIREAGDFESLATGGVQSLAPL